MLDARQRPLRDLRISVTDKCNSRCTYCMPSEIFGPDFQFLPKDKLMTFKEMSKLVNLFAGLGVEKIRITGGELLIRKNLDQFIRMIDRVVGIDDIAMTTNGLLLAQYAQSLEQAGLKRVTVSLDSLDAGRFGMINGRGYNVQAILDGIEEAAAVGLQVKINMVVQRGVNAQDILPMALYFYEKGHDLRFIEFMDVGNSNGWELDRVVPNREILDLINSVMPLQPVEPDYFGEVASRYRYISTDIEIGFISSVTQAFCSTCTRARITAEGKLYLCLFASEGYDLLPPLRSGCSDEEICRLIVEQWNRRDDHYSEIRLGNTEGLSRKKVEMSRIGG